MCYSCHYDITKKTQCQALCYDFVSKATSVFPELKRKLKIHLFLHLPECLEKFGSTSRYSAERLYCILVSDVCVCVRVCVHNEYVCVYVCMCVHVWYV